MIALALEINSILATDLLDVLFTIDCATVGTSKYRVLRY
jgi:hypothetical protein